LPTRALARKPYRRSSIRQQPRIYRATGDQWVNFSNFHTIVFLSLLSVL